MNLFLTSNPKIINSPNFIDEFSTFKHIIKILWLSIVFRNMIIFLSDWTNKINRWLHHLLFLFLCLGLFSVFGHVEILSEFSLLLDSFFWQDFRVWQSPNLCLFFRAAIAPPNLWDELSLGVHNDSGTEIFEFPVSNSQTKTKSFQFCIGNTWPEHCKKYMRYRVSTTQQTLGTMMPDMVF